MLVPKSKMQALALAFVTAGRGRQVTGWDGIATGGNAGVYLRVKLKICETHSYSIVFRDNLPGLFPGLSLRGLIKIH